MRTTRGCPVSRCCCTCRGRGGLSVGELERWLRGPVPSVAPQALLGVCLPVGASGASPVAHVSRARVVWARGPRSERSCEPSLRPVGLAGGCPRGGALSRCEGRLRSGARPPPAAPPPGGLSGSATHVLWVWVCGCGGPALSSWLACPVGSCAPRGWWEVVPGGLPSTVVRVSGVGRCPSPGRSPLGAGSQGSATRVFRTRLVCAWGPSTGPTACVFASRRCALCGLRNGVPGGGAFRPCEGRLSSGALPPPAARPLSGLWGSATHVLWARVCGCGGPAMSLWLACPAGGCMPRGWWEAVPGGLAFHPPEGRLVSDAVPPPVARPLGRAARVPRPVFPGRGWCGCGDPAPAPQRVPLRAVVARRGSGGCRASPGACLAPLWASGCPSSGRAVGVRYPRAVGAGGRAWRSIALSLWLACPAGGCLPRGWWEAVAGGVACHRWGGCLVLGAVPPPVARALGRAARVPRAVFPGRGWRYVVAGTQHHPHSVHSCEPSLRAVAVAGRRPRGGVLRRCEGRLSTGALPPPAARPRGGLLGSATHVLWARPCGGGGPALSLWHARPAGGCVPRGWLEAVQVKVAFHCCEGLLVSGPVPPPAARPLGRAAGVPRPVVPGHGWCGRGDPAAVPRRALFRAVVARCGAGGRESLGGLPCAVVRGV